MVEAFYPEFAQQLGAKARVVASRLKGSAWKASTGAKTVPCILRSRKKIATTSLDV